MPFYEYECASCRFYVEVMQKISEAPLKKCPSCGKPALKKLVSAPVFRLKGSGWYETDFKSDKESKRNLVGEGEKEPANETKADAKPETKPAEAKADDTKSKPVAKPVRTAAAAKRASPATKRKTAAKSKSKRR